MYGYRKFMLDMRESGENCGKHCMARLLKSEELRSQTSYPCRPGSCGGKPAVIAPNHLQRQSAVDLAVVLDLFSRQVVGWSMGHRIDTMLALDALMMALWRRQPKQQALIH